MSYKEDKPLNSFFYEKGHEIQKPPLEVCCKKVVLKNFVNFIGKHLCWSLFLIKLQGSGLQLY